MKIREGFAGQRSLVLPKMIVDMLRTDPATSTLYITDIGYYPSASCHYVERRQPIGQHVLIYCMDGNGWFECNGSRHAVAPNTYFILPPDVPHSYGANAESPWSIYWIHFSGRLAAAYAPQCAVPHTVSPGVKSRIDARTRLFEEILEALNSGFNIDNIRYALSVFHHYLGTLRYLDEYRNAGTDTRDADIVNVAVHYMGENIERTMSLEQLSSFIGFSPSYLSTVFKTRTGHAPMAYFNLLKMRRACDLLDRTDMKICNICHKVGISDPYYFSRIFTKIMGLSPSAYRSRPAK